MKTRLTELLGIETPIICGGLFNDIPTCKELVANVVNDATQIIQDRLAGMVAAS